MDRATARLCSRFLGYGLPFLYLLTAIAFYLHTYDSAQVKITIVQMLGTTLIGVWYLKLICDGGVDWRRYAVVAVPLMASLASGLFSFSHAAYPGPSIDECLRRVFYIHFALIALTEINTLERLKRVITFLLVATGISVGYGLIEILDFRFFPLSSFATGIDPFIWRQAFGSRIFSTFGNPNFFGNFLVILTPITLALLLKRNRERPLSVLVFALTTMAMSALIWQVDSVAQLVHLQTWEGALFFILLGGYMLWSAVQFSFLGILFFLITFCNVLTVSKGAWVGYGAGIVSFLMLVLFYFSQFQSEKLKRTLKTSALATLVICTLGVGIYSYLRIDSLRFRIFTWVSTWEMGYEHPLIGNGVGTFRVLYPAYRRPQIFHIEGKHNTETDHSENEYFEVFQDEGLIGLGIFLWVIVTFSALALRALRRFTEGLSIRDPVSGKRKSSDDPRAYYMLGILAAFWGMLMHNGMDVSLRFVSSGIFLWLLAGLIGAMVIHDPLRESDLPADKQARLDAEEQPPVPVSSALEMLLNGLRAVTAVLFLFFTVFIFRGFNDAQGPVPVGSGEALLWVIAWIAFTGTVGACLYVFFNVVRSLRALPAFLVLWAMLYPLQNFWGYFRADVHHNRGIFFSKQQKWDEALKNYQEVVRLNPNYIMAYYFMGNVYTDRWQAGDFERAMTEYGRAWAIAPNYVQSHHQAGLVYLKKGADAKKLEEQEKAWEQSLIYFQKYHDIDPVFEPNYLRMAWVHMQMAELWRVRGNVTESNRHLDTAESLYKESLGAWVCGSPGNNVLREDWHRTHRHFSAEVFENLGNVRFTRGRYDQALRAFKMAVWKDPGNVRAWKNLALVYARLGDQANVIKTWSHIQRLAPNDPDVQKVFRRT
jgi:tetratricopeptide (TPR) repeat protein